MEQVEIKFEKIKKIFPGCRALDDVSFDVKKGEVHALLGENGAGKSTLLNILHGNLVQDSGQVWISGQPVSFHSPYDAICAGIAKVHQEISVIPDMTVMQNLMLGREKVSGGFLCRAEMTREVKKILTKVHLHADPSERVANLSTGELQLLQIAKAISIDAKIISFDEPTASLSKSETGILFEIIEDLKRNGVTILYVSHRLDEIFQIADRCTILRDGRYIGTFETKSTTKDQLIQNMVGRNAQMFAKRKFPSQADLSQTVLRVDHLSGKDSFEDVCFSVHKGEILGFYGLVGAQRTQVMRAIFGADPISSGTIFIREKPVRISSPAQAIRKGIGLLPENRKTEGFVKEFSNMDNIALASLKRFEHLGFLRFDEKRKNAVELEEKVHVRPPDPSFATVNLSGGNQQKIVLAKWLSSKVDIMIFDEPTKGIDVGAKEEIYALMEELVAEGKSILLVSSDQTEVIGMSDRIIVMHAGKVIKQLERSEFDETRIVTYALGGE